LALLSFVLSFQQQRMERRRNPRALQRVLKLSGKGCGGDSELNKKKNRTDMLVASDVETFKRADFVKLKFPAKWKRGTKRTLLESWGEGTPVELEAYLIKTKHHQSFP